MQPIRTKCKYGYIVFAITLLIAIDYVYRYFAFEPYNQSPLNIETPEGNAQPYHPSVVYIPGGWNGYAYWMADMNRPPRWGRTAIGPACLLTEPDGKTRASTPRTTAYTGKRRATWSTRSTT